MSECVVRMEKPESCLECPLRIQCEMFCDWLGRFGTSATRKPYPKPFDKGCHILNVLPEGHGRLADADKLMKNWQTWRSGMYAIASIAMIDQVIKDLRCAVIAPAEAERSET